MTVIEIPQTYLRMGRKSFARTLNVSKLVPGPTHLGEDFGILAVWSRRFDPWLKVRLETGGKVWEDGGPDEAAYLRVCAQTRSDPNRLAVNRVLFNARVAFIKRSADVNLRLEIITDNRNLASAVEERKSDDRPGCDLDFTMTFYSFDTRNEQRGPFDHAVKCHISPLTPLHAFPGFVSLDVGNYSSSVACLRNGETSRRDIRLAERDTDQTTLKPSADSQASLVRIDEITTWYPNQQASQQARFRTVPDVKYPQDEKAGALQWVIGQIARSDFTSLARQVSGAKRMMVRADNNEAFKMPLSHRRVFLEEQDGSLADEFVDIRYRLPAELLASSLIQQFLQATEFGKDCPAGWPRHLAVTYPTSYAPAEIHALRCTVQRAWLRALNENQSPTDSNVNETSTPTPDEKERRRLVATLQKQLDPQRKPSLGELFQQQDELITLMIDEATAASFHYLFRFSAEAVGGLVGFRLKYPDGMNLLLYDCGGGTTDIALVQAKVESDNTRLTLTVLGRSGVRHFGGDDITAAVCRLLKAKITAAGLKEKGIATIRAIQLTDKSDPQATYKNAVEVARFLKAVSDADPQSRFVPTRFDPSDVSPETNAPRERALTLWSWGEQLKQLFSKPADPKLAVEPGQEPVLLRTAKLGLIIGEDSFTRENGSLNAAILEAVFGSKTNNDKGYGNDLLKIQIHRDEVDAMIARQVIRTLSCCRSLIQQKLPGERHKVAPVVHKVAVTGGAARYPLIREVLRQRLQVSDLEPVHWFHYDEADLKNVVAKGAVQALAALNAGIEKFRFDSRMADSLPFDVAYQSRKTNDFIPIYHLQQKYASIESVTVPIAETAGDDPTDELLRQFPLFRRYAGDGEQLDLADQKLPIFEDGDELVRLEEQKGYELYLIFGFANRIEDSVTVYYDKDTHTFGARDSKGNEGIARAPDSESLRARAPHERGKL